MIHFYECLKNYKNSTISLAISVTKIFISNKLLCSTDHSKKRFDSACGTFAWRWVFSRLLQLTFGPHSCLFFVCSNNKNYRESDAKHSLNPVVQTTPRKTNYLRSRNYSLFTKTKMKKKLTLMINVC